MAGSGEGVVEGTSAKGRKQGWGLVGGGHGPPPSLLSGQASWGSFSSCPEVAGCCPLSPSLSPTLLDRFDSNASASSSSNEGDSDREEKKRKQLKKAKMAKDRKSRKKPVEVETLLGGRALGKPFSLPSPVLHQ